MDFIFKDLPFLINLSLFVVAVIFTKIFDDKPVEGWCKHYAAFFSAIFFCIAGILSFIHMLNYDVYYCYNTERIIFEIILNYLIEPVCYIKLKKWRKRSCYEEYLKAQEKEKRAQEEEKRAQEEEKLKVSVKIYEKCREKSIGLEEKDQQDLLIIAKSFNINNLEEARECYMAGKKQVEAAEMVKHKEELEKRKERLNKLRDKEQQHFEEEKEAATLFGKAKYTKALTVAYQNVSGRFEFYKIANEIAKSRTEDHPYVRDAAIAGGLANGIAGGAAGVATALKVQQQNEIEKQRSASTREEGYQLLSQIKALSTIDNRLLGEIKKVLDHIDSRIIDAENVLDKFNMLVFSDLSYNTLESGNIKVTGKVRIKEEPRLLDSPAILDGGVIIKVINSHGAIVGHGYYSPDNICDKYDKQAELNGTKEYPISTYQSSGFSKYSSTFSSICITNGRNLDKNEKITYIVEPINMWLIEQ